MRKRRTYIIGVDPALMESKTIIVVVPRRRPVIDVEKDIEWVRRRIADELKVPLELLNPEPTKIQDHPAFNNGAVIRMICATFKPEKPQE